MSTETKAYPVTLKGELTALPSRWLWIFKWLLAIPHYVVLFFLGIVFVIVTFIAFWAIVFTGKYPRGLFDFTSGVLRWAWRVGFYSYQALGTDKYPPFSLDPDPNYPADLEIKYPEKLSQGLVWVKWLLAIPQLIIVCIFLGGLGKHSSGILTLLVIVSAIIMLFTGNYIAEMFKLAVGMNRWSYRTMAYVLLMTDEYPPYRLRDNELIT
jgi:hypothetical protein